MQVQVEKKGPCEARVAFKVPAQEFERRYEERLRAVGRQARLKGFRPGKVPADVVRKLYGTEVERETKETLLREAYEHAIKEEKLRPAAHPRVSLDELVRERGADFEHAFELPLKPDFTLGEFEGLPAKRNEVTADDKEVEATLMDVRRQQARPEVAGEEGLQDEGLALARVELVHAGEVVASRDGLRIGLKTTPNGVDPKTFEDALRGKTEGSDVEVPMVFPADFERAEFRGKEGLCRVHLNQVFKLTLPEEDELLRVFRADDAADLRAKIKEQLLDAKRQQEDFRIEQELFDRVLDAHPMDLPAPLLEAQVESRFATARQQLADQGVPPEDIEKQLEGDRDMTHQAAERSLRALYLVEAIADKASLRVSQDDMVAELRRIAQRNRASFEEVRDYYDKNGLLNQLAIELLERKVKRHLREKATAG